MKKAGIITIFGEWNYGNRLQNYAVQEVLKKLGIDAETIKYIGLSDTIHKQKASLSQKRLEKFREFNENIKFYPETMYKEIDVKDDFHENFDYIIIGSDQIWNFTYHKIFCDKVFGSFAPNEKRISFSASFGISYIPEKTQEIYDICKNGIEGMHKISVREDSGKEIVQKLTGRDDATVLIDPTMMLTDKDWEKMMKKPENLKTDRYILKLFLGNASEECEREIERVAKENNCEIIDIMNPDSPYFEAGPAEFLYLEKNAFLVATDSFHSAVFAMLFATPFIIFKRDDVELESMHSRIETLLNTFQLENRIFKETISKELLNHDFEHTKPILEKQRQKVIKYFKEALN